MGFLKGFHRHFLALRLQNERTSLLMIFSFFSGLVFRDFILSPIQQVDFSSATLSATSSFNPSVPASQTGASAPSNHLSEVAYKRWGVKSTHGLGPEANLYFLQDGVYQDFPPDFVKRESLKGARLFREQIIEEADKSVLGFVDQVPIASRRYMARIDYGYMLFPVRKLERLTESAPPDVFLSTLLTAEGFRVDLINQFLGHYRKLGIKKKNMLVTINVNERVTAAGLKQVVGAISKHSDYYDIFVGNWSSEALTFHQAHKLLSGVRPQDWVVTADSDEFHHLQHHANYPEFLQNCDKVGVNFVRGTFVDRLAETGELLELQPSKSISSQYPLACRLSKALPTGSTKKIMAYKGWLRINRGHHRLALCDFYDIRGYTKVSPYGPCSETRDVELVPHPTTFGVHHFKWMKGVAESTKYKASRYMSMAGKAKETGLAYTRLVEHLEENEMRFNVSEPLFECQIAQPFAES